MVNDLSEMNKEIFSLSPVAEKQKGNVIHKSTIEATSFFIKSSEILFNLEFVGRFNLLIISGAVRHQPNNWLYRTRLDRVSATNLCYTNNRIFIFRFLKIHYLYQSKLLHHFLLVLQLLQPHLVKQ